MSLSADAFSASTFDAASWVNAALKAEAKGEEQNPLEVTISVLITKLQLLAADVDADVQRHSAELLSASKSVSREVALAREQTGAVRTELGLLLEEVSALESRSESVRAIWLICRPIGWFTASW